MAKHSIAVLISRLTLFVVDGFGVSGSAMTGQLSPPVRSILPGLRARTEIGPCLEEIRRYLEVVAN